MTYAASFVESGPCWVCGGLEGRRVHQAVLELAAYREQDPELASYTGQSVWLFRCRTCGFAQPERLPSLPGYFDRMYDQRWSSEWIAAEFEATGKDLIFSRVLMALERRLPVPRRTLLDIGAHAGRFLDLARRAGWQVEGIELNPRTAAYAAERAGVPVHRVNAQQLAFAGRRFDAVTLVDVLEHVPRPVELLTGIRNVMTPGGWLAVKVPNGAAQQFKETLRAAVLRRYRATLADNLVHVNHFSPRALTLALTRAGFDDVAVEVAAPELPAVPGWRGAASTALRLSVFRAACVPGGLRTPLALNLQAYARAAC